MNNLKTLRTNAKLTVRDLAEKININYATLSRLENSESHFNNDYIAALTNFFNVSADYLLGLSDIPNPKDHQLKYFANAAKLVTLEDIVLLYDHEHITIRFFPNYIKITFDDQDKPEVTYNRIK